jgi:tight adherence protein B
VNVSATTMALGWAGLVLSVIGGVAALAFLLLDPASFVRVSWKNYVAALEYELRFQLIKQTGERVALTQLAVFGGLMAGAAAFGDLLPVLVSPLVVFAPLVVLRSKHDERVRLLEESLDGWLLMLANALKASPSLGEALQSSAKLIRPPFSEELDLVIKENKLGTPLDQALLNMSTRIKSRIISSSLATVLVGRQTGGDLPSILEQSASTLREMARLEGVVRTKTAEGKMQATVLAVIPFVLLFALHQVDNNWLRPLFQTTIGYVVLMAATILWASAILVARRILTVDI